MTKHHAHNKDDENTSECFLSESQEILLEKFCDDECSFIEKFTARRLLKTNSRALPFVNRLLSTRECLQQEISLDKADLWPQISIRLHEEDRSMHKMGFTDQEAPKNTRFTQQLFGWRSAATAGVIALSLVVVVFPKGSNRTTPISQQAPLALNGGADSSGPVQMLSRRIPSAVEVDWMRSDGRLQMMNESQARAPIIWIKRRASHGDALLKKQPNGSQGVVVMEDRSPQGIPVSSR